MAFRSISTNEGASAASDPMSLTVSVPSGVQDGDIILVVATLDRVVATAVNAVPSGFTQLYFETVTRDGQFVWVGWKRASSESGTYTLQLDNAISQENEYLMQAAAFSGRIASGSPIGASSSAVENTGQSSPVSINATGVTAAAGDDLVWISAPDVVSGGIGNGHSPPSGYTERSDAEGYTARTLWCNLSIATLDNASAGATGTVTGTFSLTSGDSAWCAFLIALTAAAGGGGSIPLMGQACL